MTRCADAFTPDDQADSAHPPGVHERAAPLIVSAPIGAALLAEMTGLRHRLASWAIRLAAPHPADAALPAQALAAVISGCQWLRVAEAATWAADSHRPSAAADRALLRAIPANAPPPRHPPHGGEPVP